MPRAHFIVLTFAAVVALSGVEREPLAPTPTAPALSDHSVDPVTFAKRLAAAPPIVAAYERLIAMRRLTGAAGRLPDPEVGAGLARRHTPDGGIFPMWDVQIEQTLPRWGERDAALSLAAADALAADAEFRMQLGDLAGDMAMALADGEAARATGLLLDAQIARTSAVDQALVTRIATGSAAMADRLALMTQLTDLRLERERLTAAFTNSDAEVRGRLGLAANELLPAFAAPDPTVIVIEQTPQVVAARAGMSQAEARLSEARSQGHPMTAIGLRFERESPDMGNEDTLGLEMRVSLPVYQGSIAAGVDAAHAQRRAAAQDALTAQYRAQTMLARVARATAVAQRAREAAEVNRSRLDAAYQALAGAAGAQGEVGVTAILALLDRMTSTERQVIDADAACRAAQADLWRLAPPLPDSIP